jgi:hypothetical protein
MNSKSNKLPACSWRFALVCVLLFCFFSLADARTVTLVWDSNDEPDLEGYVVYRNVGSPGPPYRYNDKLPEEDLDNPLSPRVTLTGLQENKKYYVAVTAYDTDGNESNFSKDVCFQIIDSAISTCSTSVVSGGSSSGGGGGGGCFISTAGLKNAGQTFAPFFMARPIETFFAVLFLLLVAAAKSVLFIVVKYIKTNKEILPFSRSVFLRLSSAPVSFPI